jgi:hypothetical protein
VEVYGGRHIDDLFMGTAYSVGIGDCMDTTDFWRVEDSNNITTHRKEIL